MGRNHDRHVRKEIADNRPHPVPTKRQIAKAYTLFRRAVRAMEQSWDAQRDLEHMIGYEFDGMGEWVNSCAVGGWTEITREHAEELLKDMIRRGHPLK